MVGFNTNMISYLTKQLHMPSTKAANTITNFSGTASLTPLIGAFIADSYVGRFWTITVASILYQIVYYFSLPHTANFHFFIVILIILPQKMPILSYLFFFKYKHIKQMRFSISYKFKTNSAY